MRQVLVTGGTGIAGKALVRALVNQGAAVRVLARSPDRDGAGVIPGTTFFKADITDAKGVAQAVQGVDVVFHLAGKLGFEPGEAQLPEAFERVNVQGTRTLVAAAEKAGVDRLVFFSSISVYGSGTSGGTADERSVLMPDSWYGLSKASAEAIVLGAKNASGKPMGVVLRVASVYGPPGKKSYAMLITMVKYGIFVIVGKTGAARTLVYDTDLARAAILAAEHPRAPGQVFNVTDGCVHRIPDIGNAIGKALGKRFVKVHIPAGVSSVAIDLIGKLELSFSFLSVIRNLIGRM
ncbi:MAG: NAD-dependent epimerase/dehydratase family protein, partial [Pseudomonadota bacterium]